MTLVRRASLSVLAVAVMVVAVGYLSAQLRLEQCRTVVAQQLASEPVFGRNFCGERVRVEPKEVSARVTGPFRVETTYMVPADLHGTLHIQTFTALPWGVVRSTSRMVDLV